MAFLFYNNIVSTETIEGRPITMDQIQAWADEAEAGYDASELQRRGRGRPGRAAEPMEIVAVRLTKAELTSLDATAARHGQSRSAFIRDALAVAVA